MLITSTIPNLVNGVSQQPPKLRLASQSEDQVNFLSSISDGLTKRPGTRHVAKLTTDTWDDAYLHPINRDVNERYVVVVRPTGIRVFDTADGSERTVNAPDGYGYLSTGSKTSFRAVTVADFTFIVNTEETAQMSSATSPERPNHALVAVRGGNYGRRYRVYVDNNLQADYETPDGSDPTHVRDIDTVRIATQIANQLSSNLPGSYSVTRRGDVIRINRGVGTTKYAIRVEDGAGGTNMVAVYEKVQRFSDLPSQGRDGFQVEVVGDQSSAFDNYHLKFDGTDGTSEDTGVWRESLKGGEQFSLLSSSMPHILVREADGTFTFKRASWEDRKVGDLDKMPFPSFAGRKIRDIFFHRNRLGLIADENVIMSQAGEFFNFFRSSATTLLDSDPIDIAVTSTQVAILNYAVPFNDTLLLFSDQAQFTLQGGDILTPDNVSISQTTRFESNPNIRPAGVGSFIYFAVPKGNHSGVREYFVQEGNEQNDALDVTAHVPRFLPPTLFSLSASSSEDMLVFLAEESPNSMWVYKFYGNEEGKLQSAWSRWVLSTEDTILNATFIESSLFLVVSRADGSYLETLNIESGSTDVGSEMLYRADRGLYETQMTAAYDAGADTTTWTLPYPTNDPLWVLVRAGDADLPEGLVIPHTTTTPSTFTTPGDTRNRKLFVGQKMVATYTFSTFFPRVQEGSGVSAQSDGRLQLRYLSIDYDRTGYFSVSSTPTGRATSRRTFTGRRLGVQSGTLGAFSLMNGRFQVPIQCRNLDASITIETDSFLPASFTGAEWEAYFINRARKV